jgi:AcrR family transcriptional regulator
MAAPHQRQLRPVVTHHGPAVLVGRASVAQVTNSRYFEGVGRIAGVTPQETRARLIESASRVFAERGYEGTRVADIARDAGLSSGAIYAHYRSKAELLVDAIKAHGPEEVNRLLAAGDLRTPLPDILVRLGSTLEHRDPTQSSLLLEAIAAARRDPDLALVLSASLAKRERFMVGLMRQSQQAGDLDDSVSPQVVARFCLMVVMGALLSKVVDLPAVDPNEWTHFMTRLVGEFRPDQATETSENETAENDDNEETP